VRHKLLLSRRLHNRTKARHPAYAGKAARRTTEAPKAKRRPSTRATRRGNQPTRE
jgi:hypothetical protein